MSAGERFHLKAKLIKGELTFRIPSRSHEEGAKILVSVGSTEMVGSETNSTPLPIGVRKICATCKPIKNEYAMTTAVNFPPELYAGSVNLR